jgi:hypothetical protein
MNVISSALLARTFCAIALFTAALVSVHAEVRTLTDKQGRSLQADVIEVTADTVKIKRADGQLFDLPLSTLTETDQKILRELATKLATEIPPTAIEIQLSRGVFDTKKKDNTGSTTIEEQWGYSVTVFNRSTRKLSDLRFDYVLFVKPATSPGTKPNPSAPFKRTAGSNTVAFLKPISNTVFKTDTIKVYKEKLDPGWIWTGSGNNNTIRDTLTGIWIKVYSGDQLVTEICNPESLAKTEKGP